MLCLLWASAPSSISGSTHKGVFSWGLCQVRETDVQVPQHTIGNLWEGRRKATGGERVGTVGGNALKNLVLEMRGRGEELLDPNHPNALMLCLLHATSL